MNVSAIVLANLCVSYIMTSQNEEAEELMRKIEKEEEQVSPTYHTILWNQVNSWRSSRLKRNKVLRSNHGWHKRSKM